MEKNYNEKMISPRFSSQADVKAKTNLAKIILLICILALIAAKSFSQCTYNATEVSPTCGTTCNGVVQFTASGGTAPYFLNISSGPQVNFNSTYQWTTSCSGWQSYSITDALGNCQYLGAVFVNSVSAFTASITAAGPTTFCYGNNVTLNASPTGSGYTYQWRKNSVNITGATSSSYVAASQGNYNVVISDGICSGASNGIAVTITNLSTLISGKY
jgi:hypothetical protein